MIQERIGGFLLIAITGSVLLELVRTRNWKVQRRRSKRTRSPRRRSLADEKVMAIWRRVCPGLMKKYPGGVLAVHRPTGEWYAGRDSAQAAFRALRHHPDGNLYLLCIDENPTCRMK